MTIITVEYSTKVYAWGAPDSLIERIGKGYRGKHTGSGTDLLTGYRDLMLEFKSPAQARRAAGVIKINFPRVRIKIQSEEALEAHCRRIWEKARRNKSKRRRRS